ncbi:hypothetical protein [Roseicella sp. DB1501]|uniref:hypothetical protein n=1 Tax=Roseicella sp. DB1501 TaxID=2730925 RepID=UPI0014908D08|nr:hypothetical protein [Roseicella sp. DB1501]NOG73674.1 hypothetical protein [Roseicella sp. DB1501]
MKLRMLAAILTGLGAGAAAMRQAASSLGNGRVSGVELLVILAMSAIGIATTALGAGGIAFYGLGFAELWWGDHRRCKERADPR